ncbi:hypothetical protein RclHR1_00450015 [Rhizophagus clarus]|uniref:Glycoside hydrolase family 20 protein n=1 Tax=Rhizophagus clarus TaxID=94130 RepID=A0A2Z6RZ68_9GLOM|nr:hypothetical protein RclHR1_00450015 [Rhizophagus clarus]GES73712.1 glycoside hydrolase family 20 protein [Rhizophagus clarus]
MRLGDFSLEVLVNNEVLPEYQIPSNNDNFLVPFSQVAVNGKKESIIEECKFMTYVAIPEPSCHFAIRVGVHFTKDSHIIKGIHFVDGQNDNTYMELNPTSSNGSYNYVYGFYNFNKSIFHLFKFDSTYWSDGNIFISNLPKCIPSKVTNDKGSLGAISVYFYKAEKLPEKRISSKKYSNIIQNIELSNSFDDLNFDPSDIIFLNNPQEEICLNLKTTHSNPIAVLHIYYQTKEWIENYYKSKDFKSLNNSSFIKKNKTKVINEDFTMDDLLDGDQINIDNENEYFSSDSKNKQKECSLLLNNIYEEEKVMMINNFKKKKIIDDNNKTLIINNYKNRYNSNTKEILITDDNNFKINNKELRNFDKNKNKNTANNKEMVNNVRNNIINNISNNSNIEAKVNRNSQFEESDANAEIEIINKINGRNLSIETGFKNICFDNIINKTSITENIFKKDQIIIIDDNNNSNNNNISDDELIFISKAEFEKKKIKETIDLTID